MYSPLSSVTCFSPFFNAYILQSVSAFAPIANPINCPWGQKAFTNYLGNDKAAWEVKYQVTDECPSFLPEFRP